MNKSWFDKKYLGFDRFLFISQGTFYLTTGLWPFINAGSFQKVTGPKTDFWLVKTVGVLVSVIGGVFASINRKPIPKVTVLVHSIIRPGRGEEQ